MIDNFLNADPKLQAGIISAVIGLFAGILGTWVKHAFDKRALRHKLETEYEYEERKKLRELIGRFHGRMLEAADDFNHRLWNLQVNKNKKWLMVNGNYNEPEKNSYFTTTVYRFLCLMAICRLFDKEAIYIDSRIAKKNEISFLKFIKALQWAMTSGALFDGLNYDTSYQTDHFFKDKLRMICDIFIEKSEFINLEEFQLMLHQQEVVKSIKPILTFFDGLHPEEQRLRWDRIISFHLILMAFINTFGYDMQKSSVQQFEDIAKTINNKRILANLSFGLNELGIVNENEAKKIRIVVHSINKS